MVYADGQIILRSEEGPVAMFKATPAGYEETGRFEPSRATNRPGRTRSSPTGVCTFAIWTIDVLQAQVSGEDTVHSFPPIARADARVLILGSMPSEASLAAGQYYGHPRNAFWPILAELLGFDHRIPYDQRVQAVLQARVAVWDVLASCVRPGSADADIDAESILVNDFETFLRGTSGTPGDLLQWNNGRHALSASCTGADAAINRNVQPPALDQSRTCLPQPG